MATVCPPPPPPPLNTPAIHLQGLVNSDRATALPQASCCRGPTAVAPTPRLPTCLGLCSARRVGTSFSQWRHPPSESHRAAWPRLLEGPLSYLNCRCSFATTVFITNTKTLSLTDRTRQPRPLGPQTISTTHQLHHYTNHYRYRTVTVIGGAWAASPYLNATLMVPTGARVDVGSSDTQLIQLNATYDGEHRCIAPGYPQPLLTWFRLVFAA